MVDLEHSYIWTWDARPFPAFPSQTAVWTDGDNWRHGHWINGRLGNAPLSELISSILTDHGFEDFDVSMVEGTLQGFVQAEIASARSLLERLMDAFLIDVREGEDRLIFSSKVTASKSPIFMSAIVDQNNEPFMRHQRRQEAELANEVLLSHLAPENDYQSSIAYSRRLSRDSQRQEKLNLPGSVDKDTAANIADQWLQDHWASREVVDFNLPMDAIALEIGDRIQFEESSVINAPTGTYTIVQIEDGIQRQISAARMATSNSLDQSQDTSNVQSLEVSSGFAPNVILMDLPLLSGSNAMDWARAAAYAKPWVPVYLASSSAEDGYQQRASLSVPAFIGTLANDFNAGVEGRFDYVNNIMIDLPFGAFETIDQSQLFAGGNLLAIRCQNEAWEMVQFQTALEIAPNQWQLSNLLRAQSGTDDAMVAGAQKGADVVFINDNVISLNLNSSELESELNWQISGLGKSGSHLEPITFAGGQRGHTPLSPVHLRGERINGGIALSWIRRGRIAADNWAGVEIPEDEDHLQFLIKIFNENSVIHEAVVEDSSYIYEDVQRLADFGYLPSSLLFSVQQIGGQIAQGIARTATISV